MWKILIKLKFLKAKLLGEVIKINRDTATIQVYENTTGLKIGEEVIDEE